MRCWEAFLPWWVTTVAGYWKPRYMSMHNHQTGKSTELHWQGYQFKTGLMEDRDFTTNSLKRVR